jgi:hypothetical protein
LLDSFKDKNGRPHPIAQALVVYNLGWRITSDLLVSHNDEAVKKALTEGKNKLEAVKIVLKNHKKAVIAVMAALEGVAVKEYQPPLLALPTMLMEVLNDPELQKLF